MNDTDECSQLVYEYPNDTECEVGNQSLLQDPDYFSHRYRAVGTFFQGIIFVVGVLGNAMVVVVVTRVRALHSPTNCYLLSLAVADTVVLVASVPNEILSYYLVGNQWVWGELGCNLIIFCQNLGINASSLSLVAFTVERYIAICHPMKAHKMCTIGRAKRITLMVWLFAVLYCSPWLGLTETRPTRYRGFPDVRECVFKRPRNEYLAYFFTDLVMFYLIPLLLSCALYALISRALINRRVARTPGKPSCNLDRSSFVSSKSQRSSPSAKLPGEPYSLSKSRGHRLFSLRGRSTRADNSADWILSVFDFLSGPHSSKPISFLL